MLHWSSLIIFFVLSLIGLWLADLFLKKNGIYIFCILAIVFANYIMPVEIFSKTIPMQTIIIPTILLAMFVLYSRWGKSEGLKLLWVVLLTILCVFIIKFFEYAYVDMVDGILIYFTWAYLNRYIASALAFAVSIVIGYFIVEKLPLKKVKDILKVSIYIEIVSVINTIIYLAVAYSGYYSFVNILLTFLLCLLFITIIALILGCFEQVLSEKFQFKKSKNKNVENKSSNSLNNKDNKKDEKSVVKSDKGTNNLSKKPVTSGANNSKITGKNESSKIVVTKQTNTTNKK